MRTGFVLKLGTIIYFVPFFFVLDPGLIMQVSAAHPVPRLRDAGSGIRSYGCRVSSTASATSPSWGLQRLARALLLLGASLAMPGNDIVGMTNTELLIVGAILTAVGVVIAWVGERMVAPA